jgi:hypothetical protein
MLSQAWLKRIGDTIFAFKYGASATPCMRFPLTDENMMADGTRR